MTPWHKLVISVIGALAFGVAVAVFGFRSLMSNSCTNQVLAEVPSPEGTLKAVVFERNCGATIAFSTQISVLPAAASLQDGPANLFAAAAAHGKAPSSPGRGPEVRVTWIGPRSLRVAHDRDTRVLLASHNAAGVSAEYVPFE